MRILLANNLFGAYARGGAERVVEREARTLTARGHEVIVVSAAPEAGNISTANGIVAREVRSANICFYGELALHGAAYRLAWHVLDMFGAGASAGVVRIARDFRADAVHTHNLMGLGFRVPHALKRAGLRHVHTVHDVQLLHPSGLLPAGYSAPRGIAERAYVAAMRTLMGSPDVVVFPSEALRLLHEQNGFFPRSRRIIVRNPAPDARTEARSQESGAPVYAFAGQLEPHKGVPMLLDAWQRWTQKPAGAQLMIMGDGTLAETVRAAARNDGSIVPRGRFSAAEVLRALAEASFVIVPSDVIENAPSVLLEAFAQGTPAIAARTGGIPELVADARTGFTFTPGSTASLADALRMSARISAADRVRMSDAALAVARSMSADAHASKLKDAYMRGAER